MSSALIGYTGFVGGNLLAQRSFDARFNSSNIEQIAGRSFDLVVCCGAPAEKWKANADPERDMANLTRLTRALSEVNAAKVVLTSTVDVFARPVGVDEDSPTPSDGLHAYGRHRLWVEELVAARFDACILRLPGLYGPGLKKNAIFDLLNDNDVAKIDSRAVFQFYNVERLWRDIETALRHDLSLVHLPTEPVSIAEVAEAAFARPFANEVALSPARYDMRTKYAALFGGDGAYIESKARELNGIATFVERARAMSPARQHAG
jgi:nucleoside-diphosphate-sugar epimerase